MKENKTFKLQNSPKGTVQFDPETGLPKDVKQYQEDIKAGVEVGGTEEKLGFLNIDGKSICLDKTIRLDTKSEQIREMLFDFWSAMRDKESDNRDNHVEKVIEKFEVLLSEQRQSILEEVESKRKLVAERDWDQANLDEGFNMGLDTVISIIKK